MQMFKTKFPVILSKMLSPKSVSFAEISYCIISLREITTSSSEINDFKIFTKKFN